MTEKSINKVDIVERISRKSSSVPESLVKDAVEIMLDQMSASLAAGERIEIRGFGSFRLNEYKPRVARNPKTGEAVQVGERRIPHFKPGKVLSAKVDNSKPN